ncbi:hypothetical protein JHK82_055549 [Glycine max]|nr:hypothetical protein JHK82_055549 [Glycine max]
MEAMQLFSPIDLLVRCECSIGDFSTGDRMRKPKGDSIEKGILELISQHGIRKFVMGAASDNEVRVEGLETLDSLDN